MDLDLAHAAQNHTCLRAEIEPNCPKANNEDELTLATVSATNISTISTDSTSAMGTEPLTARLGSRDWYVCINYYISNTIIKAILVIKNDSNKNRTAFILSLFLI